MATVTGATRLSDEELRSVIAQAGFTGQSAEYAFQIARAESGGRPKALNNNPATGDLSYGLFQVNMIGSLGPARRKKHKLASNEALYDPLTNARVAYALSNQGTNWNAWKNTAVRLGIPLRSVPGQTTGGVRPSGYRATPVNAVSDFLTGSGSFWETISCKDFWVRFLYVTGGVALIIVGIILARGRSLMDLKGGLIKSVIGAVA